MEKKVRTGKIFDMQGFSVHDGPGIRLTVFLKGCPLRCPWCHSPESQLFCSELSWIELRCIGIEKCGGCLGTCPNNAISPGVRKKPEQTEKRLIHVDRSKCGNCGRCADICPAKALYMCGADYTVPEVMERVKRELPFFQNSGGGVTFSGGECLCQPEFLLAALKCCKEEGIHTAVDTSGYVPRDFIESVFPYTDIFLYDLKCMNSGKHKDVLGVSNDLIIENVQMISKDGGKLHIRIPLIPLFNDSREEFEAYGRFIQSLGKSVETVQLLPYHKLGVTKWARLQRNNPIFVAEPPSDETIFERKEQLNHMGLNVIVH